MAVNKKDLNPANMLETFLEALFKGEAVTLLQRFDDLFPQLEKVDQCKLCMDEGDPEIDGVYDVIDFYCSDVDCDCQKVTVMIFDSNQNRRATIAYGWEAPSFYREWGTDPVTSFWLAHGFLDPHEAQSEQAPQFLEVFLEKMKNPHFKQRFRNRYNLFKAECAKQQGCNLENDIAKPLDNVIKFPVNNRR
jgi:hypothetical protein